MEALFVSSAGASAQPVVVPPAPATSAATSAPSGAAPAKPVAQVIQSRAAASASITSAAVDYYSKTFSVSATEARNRLATQNMAPGIGDALNQRFGDALASVWFDNSTGQWVVDATTRASAQGVTAVFSADGLADEFRLERVAYSHSALVATARNLATRLSDIAARALVKVGVGNRGVDVTVASSLSSQDQAAVRGAVDTANAYAGGPPVALKTSPLRSLSVQPTLSCAFPYCDTLVGGDFYSANNVGCTMSWYGSITLGGVVQPIILTAGHCTRGMGVGAVVQTSDLSANVNFGNTYYGSEDNGDWGYMYPYNPPPAGLDPGLGRPFGGYINWNSVGLSTLRSYYASGPAPNGMTVCHQGEGTGNYYGPTAGTQCGTIANNDITTGVAFDGFTHYNEMEIDNTLACRGDSGGPFDLASVETAVATDSAVNLNIAGNANCGTIAYASPVNIPIQAYSAYNMVLYGG